MKFLYCLSEVEEEDVVEPATNLGARLTSRLKIILILLWRVPLKTQFCSDLSTSTQNVLREELDQRGKLPPFGIKYGSVFIRDEE